MRGSNQFTTMKGFLDGFTLKEADVHTSETLPGDPGVDVTQGAEVDNANANAPKAANISASDNRPGAPSTTMSKELEEVQAAAEQDIADGYIADAQHLPGPGTRAVKGFEEFNNMVSKGVVIDTEGLSKFNIRNKMADLVGAAESDFQYETKTFQSGWMSNDDMMVFKAPSAAYIFKESNVAPEDEESNEGLTEDQEATGYTEEDEDYTKPRQGENDESPQTAEGEAEQFSEEGAEKEKGYDLYNRTFATKGFEVETKASLAGAGEAIKRGGKAAWEAVRSGAKKVRDTKTGEAVASGAKRAGEAIASVPGKVGGATERALKRGSRAAMSLGKGPSKGNVVEGPGVLLRAGEAAGRNRKAVGGAILGAGALGVGGGGAYALSRKKEKGFDDGVMVLKGGGYSHFAQAMETKGGGAASLSEAGAKKAEEEILEQRKKVKARPTDQAQIRATQSARTVAPEASRASRLWGGVKRVAGSRAGKIGGAIGGAALLGGGAYALSRKKEKGFGGPETLSVNDILNKGFIGDED